MRSPINNFLEGTAIVGKFNIKINRAANCIKLKEKKVVVIVIFRFYRATDPSSPLVQKALAYKEKCFLNKENLLGGNSLF